VDLEGAGEVPFRLPAVLGVEGRVARERVHRRHRGAEGAGADLRLDLLEHEDARAHARGRVPPGGGVGLGGVLEVAGPEPGLGHQQPELGPGRAGRQRARRLEAVVGGRAVAVLLPG
jgi:hypothetical protein